MFLKIHCQQRCLLLVDSDCHGSLLPSSVFRDDSFATISDRVEPVKKKDTTKNVGRGIKRGKTREAIIAVTQKAPRALRGKLLGSVVILGIDRSSSDHMESVFSRFGDEYNEFAFRGLPPARVIFRRSYLMPHFTW